MRVRTARRHDERHIVLTICDNQVIRQLQRIAQRAHEQRTGGRGADISVCARRKSGTVQLLQAAPALCTISSRHFLLGNKACTLPRDRRRGLRERDKLKLSRLSDFHAYPRRHSSSLPGRPSPSRRRCRAFPCRIGAAARKTDIEVARSGADAPPQASQKIRDNRAVSDPAEGHEEIVGGRHHAAQILPTSARSNASTDPCKALISLDVACQRRVPSDQSLEQRADLTDLVRLRKCRNGNARSFVRQVYDQLFTFQHAQGFADRSAARHRTSRKGLSRLDVVRAG